MQPSNACACTSRHMAGHRGMQTARMSPPLQADDMQPSSSVDVEQPSSSVLPGGAQQSRPLAAEASSSSAASGGSLMERGARSEAARSGASHSSFSFTAGKEAVAGDPAAAPEAGSTLQVRTQSQGGAAAQRAWQAPWPVPGQAAAGQRTGSTCVTPAPPSLTRPGRRSWGSCSPCCSAQTPY